MVRKSDMKLLPKIEKTREYLDYLEEHILNVQKAWLEVQEKCADLNVIYDDFLFHTLDYAISQHDESKLSQEEFTRYRETFFPTPEEAEEYDGRGLGKAWEHHVAFNNHHFENWKTKQIEVFPNEIALCVIHNIVDWMAMGYKFGDTAQEYYENNKDRMNFPEKYEKFMYTVFDRLYKK